MTNFRSNYTASYLEQPRGGLSTISKNYGLSTRAPGDDHNFGEVEFMLENERKKFKQTRDKFEYDLDNERKLRIEFENKLIKIKDEFSRKQVTISQLEFKINNLLHQNQDIILENQRLKNELIRLQDLYGGKVHELQTQLGMESKNYEDMSNQYNIEFEKFKKEGQDYVEQITFDFERKIKNLEQRVKTSENIKKELGLENKKLNDILINNKLAFEEDIRDLKNKAKDQELKKVQSITKSLQQRIKMVQESKETIVRKNNELIRLIQDKDRQCDQKQNQFGQQLSKFKQDNADLHQQINHLNYIINKLKTEIQQKDTFLSRKGNDNDQELQSLKQQLQSKRNEIGQLNSTIRDLRMGFKENEAEWERRRRDMNDKSNYLQSQARKYKDQYTRICDILKTRINDTINNVSHKK